MSHEDDGYDAEGSVSVDVFIRTQKCRNNNDLSIYSEDYSPLVRGDRLSRWKALNSLDGCCGSKRFF